jgi:hypothetical protein
MELLNQFLAAARRRLLLQPRRSLLVVEDHPLVAVTARPFPSRIRPAFVPQLGNDRVTDARTSRPESRKIVKPRPASAGSYLSYIRELAHPSELDLGSPHDQTAMKLDPDDVVRERTVLVGRPCRGARLHRVPELRGSVVPGKVLELPDDHMVGHT